MNHHPNKHHKSSEEEFMDALEKLEEALELRDRPDGIANAYRELSPKPDPRPAKKTAQPQQRPKQEFLLSALEDAAADIDQFMASKHLHSDES
jgi:hypothetical protein